MKLFPESMLNSETLSLDSIKARLNYFELQIHELHWQTANNAEHLALGDLYNTVFSMKDDIVEEMMGYTGVKTRAMPVAPIKNYEVLSPNQVVDDLISFSRLLQSFGENNNMPDIGNLAQSLGGAAAKVKNRLTRD